MGSREARSLGPVYFVEDFRVHSFRTNADGERESVEFIALSSDDTIAELFCEPRRGQSPEPPRLARRAAAGTDAIRDWRRERGLSASEAAALVHSTQRTWQHWEAGERRMHPVMWELAKLKAPNGKC